GLNNHIFLLQPVHIHTGNITYLQQHASALPATSD
ncbi:hypothetical protein ECNE1487_2721, partial [Escherichia coli NE1487]